jgi:hypothetical protein
MVIVSKNPMVRGILTAFKWLGVQGDYTVFAPDQMLAAWRHLGIEGEQRRALQAELDELRRQVNQLDVKPAQSAMK